MTIDVTRLDSDDDTWNSHVEESPQAGGFHRAEALSVLADHADATLHRYVGHKGQEPVGVFPVFEVSRGPVTGAFSPPPQLSVPFLGPAMCNQAKLKQRKAERRHRAFLDGVLESVDEEVSPGYSKFKTGPAYDDLRPFKWHDCAVAPEYTYVIDLASDPETVLNRFSSDARRNVTDGATVDYAITEGDAATARQIIDQVRRRYAAQGRPYGPTEDYVADLYEALPDRSIRPYVCHVDGDFAGGIVAVADDRSVYRWQGGVRPEVEVDLAVNDHLDWRVMRDAMADGIDRYDLVGAGVPRINKYKAKFNPAVSAYHEVERGTWPLPTLVDLYRRLV
ncbi:GNAT family N-acetyltransferase [Halobacteriales archaeon Cl-PHB]